MMISERPTDFLILHLGLGGLPRPSCGCSVFRITCAIHFEKGFVACPVLQCCALSGAREVSDK